jgi:hypothetical protein
MNADVSMELVMKRFLTCAMFSLGFSFPAYAALDIGDKAPDFTTQAALAGSVYKFSLAESLKKGMSGCEAVFHVAADYRLKRIALAHDPSPSKKVPSYLDLAEKAVTGGPQKQHRWWFVGHFDEHLRRDAGKQRWIGLDCVSPF